MKENKRVKIVKNKSNEDTKEIIVLLKKISKQLAELEDEVHNEGMAHSGALI